MKEFTYTIRDEYGIHARPAGLLVKLAKGYASCITLARGGDTCDLKRLMPLMAMGVKQGEAVTVKAEGTDEDACIQSVSAFLEQNV